MFAVLISLLLGVAIGALLVFLLAMNAKPPLNW